MIAVRKIKFCFTPAESGVERHAKFRVIESCEGLAVVADKDLRHGSVAALEPFDLPSDLTERVVIQKPRQKRLDKRQFRCDAALVDHPVELLFQFYKDAVCFTRYTIAAHPQLFLIDRLFKRCTDEAVIVGIIVNIANRIDRITILLQMRANACHERVAL